MIYRIRSSSWDESFVQEVLSANDYVGFLRPFFKNDREPSNSTKPSRSPRAISYAEFSRRAGLASRSYIVDVLHDRKPIGESGIRRIARGLGLDHEWTRYFTLLVQERQFPNDQATKSDRELWRQQLRTRYSEFKHPRLSGELDYGHNIAHVHAAISGNGKTGLSADEIVQITGLSAHQVEQAVELMRARQLITGEANRIALEIEKIPLRSETPQTVDAVNRLNAAAERAATHTSQGAFFGGSFLVSSQSLQQLNDRIRTTIANFVTESEEPKGDRLVHVVVGFFPELEQRKSADAVSGNPSL